jgi:hypothetical protein
MVINELPRGPHTQILRKTTGSVNATVAKTRSRAAPPDNDPVARSH